MITWRLKKSQGEALRQGHPWGYARDLEWGASNFAPGSFVRVVDEKNQMVAFGYGNPQSVLAFRALPLKGHPHLERMASVGPTSADFVDWMVERMAESWRKRRSQGFRGSFRVVFSEADGLPGLILDRYEVASGKGQVLAAQILTAGMDRIWGDGVLLMHRLVEALGELGWESTVVVERKDVSVRKLEGLEVLGSRLVHQGKEFEGGLSGDELLRLLRHLPVQVSFQGEGERSLRLTADLWEGQKTGFFLDQTHNMELVLRALHRQDRPESRLRVLDLCCYVGHWSLQLGELARQRGWSFQTSLVDVSREALQRASENLQAADLPATVFEVDVMKDPEAWPAGPFDVVIADPPAFVKAKKDRPTGLHAYLKMNTEALRRVAPGGFLVTCSCSGLVSEEDLLQLLPKALQRSGRRGNILARGQQGADHPWDPRFPEGRYLKMILMQVW